MEKKEKTRKQLLEEIDRLKSKIADQEKSGIKRKETDEIDRQKSEELDLTIALHDALNRSDSFMKIMQLLSRKIKKMFTCTGVTLYILSKNREYLVMQNLSLPQTTVNQVEKLIRMKIPTISIPLKKGSLYQKILQEGKPQLINDSKTIQKLMSEFTENQIFKKLVPKIYSILNIHAVINIPIKSNIKTFGLLDISRKEPFTKFDLKRIDTISKLEIFRDISERKQVEKDWNMQKKKLHDILEGTNAGTWNWNVQTCE